MKKIKLNENIGIPILGLGTFLNNNPTEIKETIKEALKIGYRHIDTAQAYYNEVYIGEAIKDSKIAREELFITSKIKVHETPDLLREAINQSLTELQTDYLDLMLIHWPSPNHDLNYETYAVLEEFYEKGIFKAIGVSNYNIHHMDELLKRAKVKPMINQIEMHPGLNQVYNQNYLNSHGIVVQSYGPFMKGEVFNKEGLYFETLNNIATKHNASVGQVVIAWGIARNIVMIPKSSSPKNLANNFAAKDLVLTQEEVAQITKLNKARRVYSDPDNNNNYMK